jgi:arylsulfatase A-like enzyme
MMDDYYTHLRHGRNYMRIDQEEVDPEGHATDIFTDWACEILEERARADEPFFMYLAYNAPHTPIQPPEEWAERVAGREPEASAARAKYVALVEHMDAGIGQVLQALSDIGQLENTLVFYASDNGGQLRVGACNGPLRGNKGDVYEGGIRVPACAMWPGRIPEGALTHQRAMLMDLLPTACDAAGVEVDHEIEGTSVLPLLLGEEQDLSERLMYWIRREGGPSFAGLAQHAIRRGDWKLLQNRPFEPLEMFHMEADPTEQTEVGGRHPGLLEELTFVMRDEIRAAGGVPWQKPNSDN